MSEPSSWPGTCPGAGADHNSRSHTAPAAMQAMSPAMFYIKRMSTKNKKMDNYSVGYLTVQAAWRSG